MSILAEELRKGRSVDQVLAQIAGSYGPQVAAVVQAGAAANNPAAALSGLARLIQRRMDYRRQLSAAMVYPLIVSSFAGLMLITGLYWMGRQHAGGLGWGAGAGYGWFVPVILIALLLAAVLVARSTGGGWLPRHFRALRWARLAWFAELVALELEQGIPRDQAVQLSAQASGDRGLRHAARLWSAAEQRGSGLRATAGVPPLLAWTLQFGADSPEKLAAALRRLANVYWYRSERAAALLTGALPAAVLVLVAGSLALAFVVLVLGPVYGTFP